MEWDLCTKEKKTERKLFFFLNSICLHGFSMPQLVLSLGNWSVERYRDFFCVRIPSRTHTKHHPHLLHLSVGPERSWTSRVSQTQRTHTPLPDALMTHTLQTKKKQQGQKHTYVAHLPNLATKKKKKLFHGHATHPTDHDLP